jgi:hypothetical protein
MYVASVFIWMLRLFVQWFEVFLGVFASVSDACFKYFIFLHMYIVSVASECFKSRLSDAGKHSGGTGPYGRAKQRRKWTADVGIQTFGR